MEKTINTQKLKQAVTSEEHTSLDLVTDLTTGKSYLLLSKTVSERYETSDMDKAEDVFIRITGGNGRKLYKPKDLI